MIVFIEGILDRATPLSAVVNTNGIGYQVTVPVSTASKLPALGETVRLHTHAVYREDSQALYGFSSEEERDFFALLIEKVSGVGPKVGISMMSKLELGSLVTAIASGDAALLAKTPGIGKKTAERVIIELKDKLGQFSTSAPGGVLEKVVSPMDSKDGNIEEDAILALEALGYKRSDAAKSIAKSIAQLGANASVEELIRGALR